MNPLRSVGGKLALALLLVVTGALTIVYLIVVPSYRQSLVNARLDSLQSSLLTLAQNPPTSYGWQLWATDAAPVVNSRVVLFDYSTPPPADRSSTWPIRAVSTRATSRRTRSPSGRAAR